MPLLRTGAGLLTERQHYRLERVFTSDDHVEVEATWSIYQKVVDAYRNPSLSRGVPKRLTELVSLGRTFKRRATGILAYFHRAGTSNGPTDAIECRLRHSMGLSD